jgi:hypothetical protein
VFENWALRRIFGPKRDEVTGELKNYIIINLYYSPNYSGDQNENEMGGYVARMVERRGSYRALVGVPRGNRLLGRPRRRLESLQEVGWGGIDWNDLAKDKER